MTPQKDETASFVLRFTQKIFEDELGESQVQWRGHIRHVQGGEEQRFSAFGEVVEFIQEQLAKLTVQAMENKSPKAQENILSKSFDLWKRMSETYPKILIDTIKDPKSQLKSVQDQIQDQVSNVSEVIGQGLDPNAWKPASKADFIELQATMTAIAQNLQQLSEKVDQLTENQG